MTEAEIDELSENLPASYKQWLKDVLLTTGPVRQQPLDPMTAAILGRQHAAEFQAEVISEMRQKGADDLFTFLAMWNSKRAALIAQFWTEETAKAVQESGIAFTENDVHWTLDSVAFLIEAYWLPAQNDIND